MTLPGEKSLVILGASARAAAFSALRAGFTPLCGDRFTDADLRRRACVRRMQLEPNELLQRLGDFPQGPWMYTGGLENQPALVSRIAERRPLYGNHGEVISRVRDPAQWTRSLADAGLCVPPWQPTADGLPRDGRWLRKSRHGSGGRHVIRWDHRGDGQSDERWYFQQHVRGTSVSAVYVSAGGHARLLGVTEQLIGCPWCHAAEFAYAGSLGPLPIDHGGREVFESIGARLTECFGLVGLFGVDAILARGCIWPVEINPRYPASVEVLEWAAGIRAIEMHVAACRTAALPAEVPSTVDRWCGKAIVYARQTAVAHEAFVQSLLDESDDRPWPPFADIPAAGTLIRQGQPVLTVLARGESRSRLEAALRQGVARIERDLYGD